jgi:hypothetical protein
MTLELLKDGKYFKTIDLRISTHGLKVTEGWRRLAPAILKIERCPQCWNLVFADARWLERDGNVPKPKARITITSVCYIVFATRL